ncbi:MAG: sugar phosphate isomerase/epimerase [Acidobacteria bacterium]|nr:sugar phosphate isomerase/epimerase [Acidobacteriota bacterium]
MGGQGLTRRQLLGAVAGATASPALARASLGQPTGQPPLESQSIAIFSKHLQWLDYPAAARAAAAAGFDALDIPVRPGGHVLPERVTEDLPRAVDAAREAGLDVTMITTAITGVDDPHAETVLSTAAGLGIGHYRMGYIGFEAGVRATLDTTVPRWRQLAALNESLGIHGGYQNHSGTNLGSAVWDLFLVLEEVASPWIGCQYDIRHAVVEGAFSWVRGLAVIAPFIDTLVAKDFAWGPREEGLRVLDVPFGEGMVPVADYVKELRRLGVSTPFSMHFEYPHPEAGRREWAVDRYGRDRAALRAALAPPGGTA